MIRIILLLVCCMAPLLGEIKVVAFDFGGVVARVSREAVMDFFQSSLGLDEAEFEEALAHYKRRRAEGAVPHEFWIEYAEGREIALAPNWIELYEATLVNAIQPLPGMVELIHTLKAGGYQTPLLSNISCDYAKVAMQTGLYDFFHPLLLSCDIGYEKPDPRAYELLLESIGASPGECIFIDDNLMNVEAARRLGIDAIYFRGVEALREALHERGLLANKELIR
ncbi:MAG: Alpha-D-glucose 1-phosphate phosphatase YihX [Chlamydiae bacterium]|nr:Alpha-D-glucose 1-phosphate phosphatase YihX [Chlamydiota bacterium]